MSATLRLYLLVACLLCLNACKTKRLIVPDSSLYSREELLEKLNQSEEIAYFNGKAKLRFDDGQINQKATVYFRSIKDSLIWAVAKKLSVEGGRVLIRPDSIFLIHRLEKAYQVESFDAIKSIFKINADFALVEQLMIGRLPQINPGSILHDSLTAKDYQLKYTSGNLLFKLFQDRTTGLIDSFKVSNAIGIECSAQFEDYRQIENSLLPFKRRYEFRDEQNQNINLDINFSDIEINTPKEIKFIIPKHYQKIE